MHELAAARCKLKAAQKVLEEAQRGMMVATEQEELAARNLAAARAAASSRSGSGPPSATRLLPAGTFQREAVKQVGDYLHTRLQQAQGQQVSIDPNDVQGILNTLAGAMSTAGPQPPCGSSGGQPAHRVSSGMFHTLEEEDGEPNGDGEPEDEVAMEHGREDDEEEEEEEEED